jgi:hypothetical protein
MGSGREARVFREGQRAARAGSPIYVNPYKEGIGQIWFDGYRHPDQRGHRPRWTLETDPRAQEVLRALEDGPKMLGELREITGESADDVLLALRMMRNRGMVTVVGKGRDGRNVECKMYGAVTVSV